MVDMYPKSPTKAHKNSNTKIFNSFNPGSYY